MPLRVTELAKRMLPPAATRNCRPPVARTRIGVEALELRDVPSTAPPIGLPTVTVARLADAAEGGAVGTFQFIRTGDTSQPLTVGYTVGTEAGAATPGEDYTTLTGSVTFGAGSATADVTVSPTADSEFEEPETVTVTVTGGDAYLVGETRTASLTIADDPPQVTTTTTWNPYGSTELGQVTVIRPGGEVSQPLTVWFEVEGTLDEDGETLTVTMAATAVIPAGQTSLIISILTDPNNGGIANVQMPGANPQGTRQDETAVMAFSLNGQPGAGAAIGIGGTHEPSRAGRMPVRDRTTRSPGFPGRQARPNPEHSCRGERPRTSPRRSVDGVRPRWEAPRGSYLAAGDHGHPGRGRGGVRGGHRKARGGGDHRVGR
jgi:hypothetical protein